MPQNAFFPWTHDLLVSQKSTQRHFFSHLHPLSMVIFATATVVAFVLLRGSRFNFHCYTQHEATPTQKSAWKWRCDLSWLRAWKITKGIYSCKPASLNRPVHHTAISLEGEMMGQRQCWGDFKTKATLGKHLWDGESAYMFAFLSRCCFTLCITMEVEPRIAKQYKCHHCCSCKNYRRKGMEGGKKCLCIVCRLTRISWVRRKNAFWGIL